MPGPSDIARGNIALTMVLSVALTPVATAANTTAEQTFTVNGLLASDFVEVQKPTAQAGLGIVGARVSAADTLAINYVNDTAAPITGTAGEAYLIKVTRSSNTALPNALI